MIEKQNYHGKILSTETSADGKTTTEKKVVNYDKIPSKIRKKLGEDRDILNAFLQDFDSPQERELASYIAYRYGQHGAIEDYAEAEAHLVEYVSMTTNSILDKAWELYNIYRYEKYDVIFDQAKMEAWLNEYISAKTTSTADKMLEWYKVYRYGVYDFNLNPVRDYSRALYCLNEYISARANQGEDKFDVECEIVQGFLHGALGLQRNANDAEQMMGRIYDSIDLGDKEKWAKFHQFLENENVTNKYVEALQIIQKQKYDLSWLFSINKNEQFNPISSVWYAAWTAVSMYAMMVSRPGGWTAVAFIISVVMAGKVIIDIWRSRKWRKGEKVWSGLMQIAPHRQLTPLSDVFQGSPEAPNHGCLFAFGYFILAIILYNAISSAPSSYGTISYWEHRLNSMAREYGIGNYSTINDSERRLQQNQIEKPTTVESKINETESSKTVDAPPTQPKETPREEAVKAFSAFHREITGHNLKMAYSYFGQNIQNEMLYDGWAPGFANTVSSTPKEIEVEEESEDRVVLKYNLEAVDNPGGTKNYTGTAILVKTDSGWKIDDMENQLVRTLENELMLGNIAIGDTFESVKKKLGKPTKQKNENGRKCYFYPSMEIYCENNRIAALVSNSSQVATPSGIREGSSLQDVLNAYGAGYAKSRYENLDLYEYETTSEGHSVMMRFAVNRTTNRVDYISIRRR